MSERQQGRLFARQIWVSAFLDLERQRMVQRTDEAIRANLPNLTLAALELAQCLDGRNASHASRGFQFTKPPSPRSLRKWLKAFETDQLFGLADRADRRGNRTRAICHVGLGWMMKAVCGYMHPDRPTIKMIENKVKEAFDDGNAARAAQGLPIIRVPSCETVRRAIRNLEPFQVKLHRDGAAAARKMFAPVGKGLCVAVRRWSGAFATWRAKSWRRSGATPPLRSEISSLPCAERPFPPPCWCARRHASARSVSMRTMSKAIPQSSAATVWPGACAS